MDWNKFNNLQRSEKIRHTKENGVKIRTEWAEDNEGVRYPNAFTQWPDCYYHFETEESDEEAAVLWINAEFSPSNALNAIISADPPIIQVLEDNRD